MHTVTTAPELGAHCIAAFWVIDREHQALVRCLHVTHKTSIVPPTTCCFAVATFTPLSILTLQQHDHNCG
jgi:hypothetical protein